MRPQLLLLTSGIVLGGCGGAGTSEPNDAAHDEIIGGEIDRGDPAVVAILGDDAADPRFGSFRCTGTLVAPRAVLTAAHCAVPAGVKIHVAIDGLPAPQKTPQGSDVYFMGGMLRAVMHVHPRFDYVHFTAGYDIAIAELEAPVTHIAPLPMRVARMSPSDSGLAIRQVGFGVDDEKKLGVKRQTTNVVKLVTDKTFSTEGGRGTCNGDSGGPALMLVDGVEAVGGVVSYGPTSCKGQSVYTRVDAMQDFVAATLQETR